MSNAVCGYCTCASSICCFAHKLWCITGTSNTALVTRYAYAGVVVSSVSKSLRIICVERKRKGGGYEIESFIENGLFRNIRLSESKIYIWKVSTELIQNVY